MEKKLAESLKYIGSRILGAYDFDTSLIGLMLTKIFYKKEFIKKRNAAIQELISTIDKKLYFKLRNSFDGNKDQIEQLLNDVQHSIDSIILKYCQKDKLHFWINRDYYYPWLEQASLRLKWFFLNKKKADPVSYHHEIIALVQKTILAHKKIIKESVPWWNALYLWIFPPAELQLINKMLDFVNQTISLNGVDQKIITMMHLNIFLSIFNFYKKNILEDYEPDFLDDIDFMIESISCIYSELDLPTDIINQFQERVEKDLTISLSMSWEDLKVKLIQDAAVSQNQYEILVKSKKVQNSARKEEIKEKKNQTFKNIAKALSGFAAFGINSKK